MSQTRQLAAIMFTDIVGYTALMDIDEERAFTLLEKNRSIHKPLITKFNGKFLKEMGDGILASFTTVSDAVYCAGAIQKACENEPDLNLRIGINQGEIVLQGNDVFGSGVNIASRIEAIAPVGGIWVSDSVQRNIQNKKGIEIEFVKEETLKNVKQAVRIYNIKIDENNTYTSHSIQKSIVAESLKTSEKSIAILPFVNMSSDPEQEYFCDGLTEELLNVLSQLDKFKVASRTSSFMFKGKTLDIAKVGKKLNVETVLEGSVRKSQNRIRITAQLIKVSDGFLIWSERYDREMTDIFDIQDEISLAIFDALKLKLLGKEKASILKRSTRNPQAYQLYLKGRQNFHLLTPESYIKAIEFYNKAIDIEPNYSEAYAGVASCYLNLWHFDIIPADQSLPHMIKATYKSMEIDDQNADSHLAMARLRMWHEFDMKEAEKEFEKTLEINPNMPDAISHYGYLMALTGNKKKAIALGEKSMEIDPFSPMTNLNYMGIHWISMDHATSLKLSKNIIDLYPNFWGGHFCIGLYYWSQQEYKKAIQSFKNGLKLQPSIWLISFVGSLYGIIGEKDKAHSMLAKMDEMTKKQQIASFSYALVYAGLNDLKKAFDFLEKASEERTGLLIFLDIIRRQNWIPAFKNNARLLEYIERVGIPQARI